MPHVDVRGQRLFYEDLGQGEPVVFSHGLFMDHTMFAPQLDALSDRYRCIAWDERGHGRTESTPDAFSYWDSARDLLGLLDELDIERAVLVGMSQGGYLSLRAALLAPERVRALVLIDSQAGVEDPAKLPGYDQLIDSWTAPDGPPQETLDTIAAIILGAGFADIAAWQARWRAMPKPTVRQVYRTLVTREDDVAPRLAELTMPTLVIHGEQDLAIELDVAARLASALPDGELVSVAGAGHAACLTHADQVTPAIERFLARL